MNELQRLARQLPVHKLRMTPLDYVRYLKIGVATFLWERGKKDTEMGGCRAMRITPELVLEAYKTTGLKPAQGDLFPKSGCACGLGVYAAMNGKDDTMEALSFLNILTSHDYVNAFGDGFDGYRFHAYGPEFDDAFRDGQEAWEAVKHLSDSDS